MKAKGGLDLTTHAAALKGGKHGPDIRPRDPKGSRLIEEISGTEPAMPEEGDPLTPSEVALVTRWIAEGALDDTPEGGIVHRLSSPPEYRALPAIAALAWSPDGKILAVAGWHEVVLHQGNGAGILARLLGDSPRIEALAFSPDGAELAVAGGAPSDYGEVQIWSLDSREPGYRVGLRWGGRSLEMQTALASRRTCYPSTKMRIVTSSWTHS